MRTSSVGTEQDFKVTKVITHPSYHNPLTYSHDIALLKLEKLALLNRCVFTLYRIHRHLSHSLEHPTVQT